MNISNSALLKHIKVAAAAALLEYRHNYVPFQSKIFI